MDRHGDIGPYLQAFALLGPLPDRDLSESDRDLSESAAD